MPLAEIQRDSPLLLRGKDLGGDGVVRSPTAAGLGQRLLKEHGGASGVAAAPVHSLAKEASAASMKSRLR